MPGFDALAVWPGVDVDNAIVFSRKSFDAARMPVADWYRRRWQTIPRV